jgi:hypothetical protein
MPRADFRPTIDYIVEDCGYETPCWIWQGFLDRNGYGIVWLNTRRRAAHIVLYEREIGPIPVGLELDHLCRNRSCICPRHVEPVTHAENLRRGHAPNMIARRENRCSRGHLFDAKNTLIRANGRKMCRACHAMKERQRLSLSRKSAR